MNSAEWLRRGRLLISRSCLREHYHALNQAAIPLIPLFRFPEPLLPAPVAAIRFCALTGLRISEVLAIRWEDIDADNGIVHLPRTKSGARSHHIPEPASAIISALPRICDWVFSTGGGTRKGALTYSHTRKVFTAACKAADIENARLHDMRRGIMLAAAEAGANAAVLRDLLGHSSLTMANRYLSRLGQPVREAREDAAAKIAAAMAGQAYR